MANVSDMPNMGSGLTTRDIEEIQKDASKNTLRRIRESQEDGNFTPTPTWKGMEAHLRPDTPEYAAYMQEQTKIKK